MLKKHLLNVIEKINSHAKKFPIPYLTFAVFGIVTYPLYYFIWKYSASQGYENLELRLIVVLLCAILALKDYWPEKLKLFLPLYWYFTILYSLPFLFTFLLLKNNMSYMWSMNTITVLVLSILLLDLTALLIILTIGISLGIGFFIANGGILQLPDQYMTILIAYISVLFFGAIFSYRKDQLKERQRRIVAEAANIAKSEFISDMGHDLKSPFIGISGMAQLLLDVYAEQYPELKDPLEEIAKGAEAWNNVHTEILNSVNIEGNVHPESFSIHSELTAITEMLTPTMHIKNLQLSIIPLNLKLSDILITDRLTFKLILMALITNAINFTEQGKITVSVLKKSDAFQIKIADTGIGIPPDKFGYIFEQFTKLSRSNESAEFRGVGSGLYLAKKRAESINATIHVESMINKGSTFTLSIPSKPK